MPLERLSTSHLLLLHTDKQPATYSKSHKPRKAIVQVACTMVRWLGQDQRLAIVTMTSEWYI